MLDNPIWHALSTAHKSLAVGNDLAKRYPTDVEPFGAMAQQSVANYAALGNLFAPGETAALFLDQEPDVPPGFTIARHIEINQMVCERPAIEERKTDAREFRQLNTANVAEILALTALTDPGPFRQRTIELGTYLGIFSEGRLAAMAGERLRFPGFTEISAVCTHPDHRGKGYAESLITKLMSNIVQRGETPFLHVKGNNATAIRLYERLGFRYRRSIHLAIVATK